MYKALPYDPIEDFAPVGILGNVTVGVFASEKSGLKTLPEMVAAVRANPGQVSYGSPGVGSVSHLAAEAMRARANLRLLHVPYAGNTPQMTDLVGGQIQVAFTGLGSGITYAKDGRVRLLAVAAKSRSRNHPNVPALAELIPGYDAPAWLGIVAPRGTPPDVLDKLSRALSVALADREVQSLMDNMGMDPEPMTAAEFGAKMRREMPLWEEAVRASGAGGAELK
jgi:tripartite-type tricarboxylate transporter receptor subunit TctC